ncbi:MAG: carbon-nitrogen hydrolase family protein [Planctomycetota bacterium]|jgi:predicted amidohydrolase
MNSPLRVAACQMATGTDVAANAARIARAIDEAASRGAALLVLPECALSGYLPREDLDFDALERAQAEVVARAAEADIYLALGTTRREGDRLYNAALLFCPAGKLLACYDKSHLTGADERVFSPGDGLPIWRVGEWTVGIQICFDMRFPENWRILRRKGAELVLHLSNASRSDAWKVPVLEGAVRSRAAENGMFVVSANDARAPQMMVSAICDPDGRDLARAPENEEAMLFAELDRSAVKDDFLARRRTDLWRRPEHRDLLLQ